MTIRTDLTSTQAADLAKDVGCLCIPVKGKYLVEEIGNLAKAWHFELATSEESGHLFEAAGRALFTLKNAWRVPSLFGRPLQDEAKLRSLLGQFKVLQLELTSGEFVLVIDPLLASLLFVLRPRAYEKFSGENLSDMKELFGDGPWSWESPLLKRI